MTGRLAANQGRGCVFDEHRELVERRHALVHGTPDAPYECPECDAEFWSVDEWQDHHMDVHYGEVSNSSR